jgi:hypothetical protein
VAIDAVVTQCDVTAINFSLSHDRFDLLSVLLRQDEDCVAQRHDNQIFNPNKVDVGVVAVDEAVFAIGYRNLSVAFDHVAAGVFF